MRSQNRIIIHVGLPKTGTSYLQMDVFPSFEELSVLRGWESFRTLIDLPEDKRIIISDEFFSCQMTKGKLFEGFEARMKRIKEIFNNPLIIIGFRSQKDFVLSYYSQHVKAGGVKNINEIFNLENTGVLKFEDLYYEKWIEIIEQYFSDVFIYTNASLKNDFETFLGAFSDFTNLNPLKVRPIPKTNRNVRLKSVRQIEYLLKQNRAGNNKTVNKLDRLISKVMRGKVKLPINKALEMKETDKDVIFDLDQKVIDYLEDNYQKDWDFVQNKIPY